MKSGKFFFAAGFACFLVVISLFADFLSSNPPSMQNLDEFYHPPIRIHLRDQHGKLRYKPFMYRTELKDPLDAVYAESTEEAYPLQFFFKGYRYRLFGFISADRHLVGRSTPPFYYPWGTDDLGRDVLARVLAGAKTSMLVVILGLILYSALGISIGAFAGLFGGWIDLLLMRFSEFVLALPALYVVMALRAVLPIRMPFFQTLFLMVGTIAAVTWPPMARGIRGLILQLKGSGYVEAARSLGGSPAHIFRHHMIPSLLPFTFSQLAVAAPIFLLGEVILSFLNIGFRDSGESWGSMLRSLRDTRVLTDFWWNLLPLWMVFLTLLCLNLLSSHSDRDEQDHQAMRL
jgi:peptide/nickel transport system permease protein